MMEVDMTTDDGGDIGQKPQGYVEKLIDWLDENPPYWLLVAALTLILGAVIVTTIFGVICQ